MYPLFKCYGFPFLESPISFPFSPLSNYWITKNPLKANWQRWVRPISSWMSDHYRSFLVIKVNNPLYCFRGVSGRPILVCRRWNAETMKKEFWLILIFMSHISFRSVCETAPMECVSQANWKKFEVPTVSNVSNRLCCRAVWTKWLNALLRTGYPFSPSPSPSYFWSCCPSPSPWACAVPWGTNTTRPENYRTPIGKSQTMRSTNKPKQSECIARATTEAEQ